ncbi:MAG: asparagine synthase (glutamine-hydrolyzing) [Terricaulis sp.]
MCGIAGFAIEPRLAGGLRPEALSHLLDEMTARGPDGEGRLIDGGVALGMRRLSVIDLNGGWQPLFSRAERVAAFQNGEIYNYRELKQELGARGYAFKTKSDTEVIAAGYDAWGIEGLLQRLDGMFAIVIYDKDTRMLHLARDRVGEKPLYYAHAPGRAFAYGSSFVQIAALPWVEDEPDIKQLDRYVAMHFAPGDRTLLKQVRRLLPGERIAVKLDTLTIKRERYWRPRLGAPRALDAEALAEIVESAIRSRMVADVPVGVFLSGGLDSAIVAATAASVNPRIDTFSMGFGASELDETEHARAVAERIGSRHHEFQFDVNQFLALLPQVTDALDEPVGDQAMLPLFWLAREARKHVTVVLAGEGADEAFGGYGYYSPFAHGARNNVTNRIVIEDIAALQSGFPILAGAAERGALISAPRELEPDQWEADLLHWLHDAHSPLQRASAADIATWLPDDLLIKFDRMAMAHSLEGRAPFLAPAVLDAGLSLPDAARMQGEISKVLLRKAAPKVLTPQLLARKKQGFVLPMRDWLRQLFEAYSGPAAFFAEHPVPGIDPNVATQIVQRDMQEGLRRERLLFALVVLCMWRKSFERRRRDLRSLLVA